jgi:hypothetical protein
VKPLADDPRGAAAILHRLDPPQDQLGKRLTNGEGEHAMNIGRIEGAVETQASARTTSRQATRAGGAQAWYDAVVKRSALILFHFAAVLSLLL